MNRYLFWAIFVAIMFMVLIIVVGLFQKPFVNYEGAINGTNPFYGNLHALPYGTLPTVINGITTVTSIIIALSGAMIAIVYRGFSVKDTKARLWLLTVAFYSAVPLTMLAVAYNALIYGALDFSLKWVQYALYLSLADFIISMLAIIYRLSSQ